MIQNIAASAGAHMGAIGFGPGAPDLTGLYRILAGLIVSHVAAGGLGWWLCWYMRDPR